MADTFSTCVQTKWWDRWQNAVNQAILKILFYLKKEECNTRVTGLGVQLQISTLHVEVPYHHYTPVEPDAISLYYHFSLLSLRLDAIEPSDRCDWEKERGDFGQPFLGMGIWWATAFLVKHDLWLRFIQTRKLQKGKKRSTSNLGKVNRDREQKAFWCQAERRISKRKWGWWEIFSLALIGRWKMTHGVSQRFGKFALTLTGFWELGYSDRFSFSIQSLQRTKSFYIFINCWIQGSNTY